MNKDLMNQLPADEQPIASRLHSVADHMQLSPGFQRELERQLLDAAKKKTRPIQSWQGKILPAMRWAIIAFCAVFLLNWTIRSMAINSQPAEAQPPDPEIPFASRVSQGDICGGSLALAHGFDVYVTNEDKSEFVSLDTQNAIGELRSFVWSPEGERIAIVGNTTGQGNLYLTDFGNQFDDLLTNAEIGYLRDAAWSRDGKKLLLWSSQNNSVVYVINADGTGLVERQLNVQILGTPQFTPDNESIVFYGADASSAGLFEMKLDGSQTRLISGQVEDESGFAFSADGSRLAYIAMDRISGTATLMVQEVETGAVTSILGSLPIPKGSGSSLPDSANLSWLQDGNSLVFDFGASETDRAIYLAFADGTDFVRVAESAHAPAVSPDSRCLAYISNSQVFLVDLNDASATPMFLAEVPAGRSTADFRLDKLGWQP